MERLAISWRQPRAHYPAMTVLPERAAMVAARMCAPALVGLGLIVLGVVVVNLFSKSVSL